MQVVGFCHVVVKVFIRLGCGAGSLDYWCRMFLDIVVILS